MSHVTYTRPDGDDVTIDGTDGDSLMETAVRHGVDGIVGQCGGALACASCHVYVDPSWSAQVGGPSEIEDEMLDGALADRRDTSRLSCQIRLEPALDGLHVEIAPEQL